MASRSISSFPSSLVPVSTEPFMELHREISRFFDNFFRSVNSASSATLPSQAGPLVDIREFDDELCLIADLPGFSQSDLDLRIEGDSLTLKAERRDNNEREALNYRLIERTQGTLLRTVQLPFAPDPDEMRASFDAGVLTVRMPKQPPQLPGRRIQVQNKRHADQQEDRDTEEETADADREAAHS